MRTLRQRKPPLSMQCTFSIPVICRCGHHALENTWELHIFKGILSHLKHAAVYFKTPYLRQSRGFPFVEKTCCKFFAACSNLYTPVSRFFKCKSTLFCSSALIHVCHGRSGPFCKTSSVYAASQQFRANVSQDADKFASEAALSETNYPWTL